MKHVPFAALTAAERQALADVLLRSGLPLHHVCVSRTEPGAADGVQGTTMITGAGWSRSYAAAPGWMAQLERDLLALHPSAQSGHQKPGDMK